MPSKIDLFINEANDYARDIGAPVWHPHVSVIHYDEVGEIRHTLNRYKKNHGDGSPDHFFTQRSFILSWHTIIIVGAVANLHVWLCRLQARTYSEYSKLFKGE